MSLSRCKRAVRLVTLKDAGNYITSWRSLGESNPCFSLERAAS
jgi:hypothetical protein